MGWSCHLAPTASGAKLHGRDGSLRSFATSTVDDLRVGSDLKKDSEPLRHSSAGSTACYEQAPTHANFIQRPIVAPRISCARIVANSGRSPLLFAALHGAHPQGVDSKPCAFGQQSVAPSCAWYNSDNATVTVAPPPGTAPRALPTRSATAGAPHRRRSGNCPPHRQASYEYYCSTACFVAI